MAIKPLNSIEGFSVGDGESLSNVILANSDVRANNLTVATGNITGPNGTDIKIIGNGVSNVNVSANTNLWKFGSDGNLTLPANTFAVNYANGTQVTVGGGSELMPFYIPVDVTYTIGNNRQGLFALPIQVDGDLVVNGILVQVSF